MTTSNTQDAEILRQFIQRSGASPKAQVEAIEALERIVAEAHPRDMFDVSKRAKESYKDLYEASIEQSAEDHKVLTSDIARKDAELRQLRGAVQSHLTMSELSLVDKHCEWTAFKCAFDAVMKSRRETIRAAISETEGTET